MKTISKIFLAIFLVFFCFPSISFAQETQQDGTQVKSYYYSKIDVDIYINADSTFDVSETMTFHFTGNYHYAYREIAKKKLDFISNIQVFNEKGELLTKVDKKIDCFVVSSAGKYFLYSVSGKQGVKWCFDEKDIQKTWTLKYKVHGGIGYFSEHDELYWNAIFEDRDVKVEEAVVTVHLPVSIEPEKLQTKLFIGKEGSKLSTIGSYQIINDRTVRFWASEIAPEEVMTIVVGWPKGIVSKAPLSAGKILRVSLTILGIILPIFTLIFMLILWITRGRDIGPVRSIAPEFAPPSKLLPAQVGVLFDEKADMKDLVGTLVDLARRGYLQIIEEPKKFLSKQNFTFKKLKKDQKNLQNFEKEILDKIFEGKNKVSTKDLKNKFYQNLEKINDLIYQNVNSLDYFREDPHKVRGRYFLIGTIIMMFGSILFAFFWMFFWIFFAGLILAGIIILIFSFGMPARTKEGKKELDRWKGFKIFLSKTEHFSRGEKDITQEIFEQYLPYAIVMGVEKQWAERFSDLEFSNPSWYVGASGVSYVSAPSFESSLSSSLFSIGNAFAGPSSSSGFGGGGGAGGGGGGGGGGAG